jgi:hypothetical protein
MTLKFSNITKFKKEISYFENEISKIKNAKVKQQARSILDEIYQQARLLDEGYQVENNPQIKPDQLISNRDIILDLRRKLYSLINNLKST